MKLPAPSHALPSEDMMYWSRLGDWDEMKSRLRQFVYNYDNASEHLTLCYLGDDKFNLLCTDTMCCASQAYPLMREGAAVLECYGCGCCYDPHTGESCGDEDFTQGFFRLRQYRVEKERRSLRVLHPDKHIGLMPGGNKLHRATA